jgi:hypothetical protein
MSGKGCAVDDVDSDFGTVPGARAFWYSSLVGGDEFLCQSPSFDEDSLHGMTEGPSPDRCSEKPPRRSSFRTGHYQRAAAPSTSAPVRQLSKIDKPPIRQSIRQKDSYAIPEMRVHSYTLPPRFPIRRSSDECGPEDYETSGIVGTLSCDDRRIDSMREPLRDRSLSRAVSQAEMSEAPRDVLIQVAPGVRVPLRSGSETWQAIIDDFYVPSSCLGCSTTLFVIQDAAYVLCPCCRSISPMEGQFVNLFVAGAGMGFTFDDLTRWQDDILRDSR